MVRNQEFHTKFKRSFKASLELLICRQDELKIRYEYEEQPEFLSNGGISISTVVKQRFYLSSTDSEKLQELPEFKELISFVAGNELAKDLLITSANVAVEANKYSDWIYRFLFLPFFSRYTYEANGLDFMEDLFNKLYEGVEEYCIYPTIRHKHIAPLFGFGLKADVESPIRLDSNLVIRKLDSQERSNLWRRAADNPTYSTLTIYELLYAVEITEQIDKRRPSYRDPRQTLIPLQSILRVIKKYPIAVRFVRERGEPWYNNRLLLGGTVSWPTTGILSLAHDRPILFGLEDIELLRELWQSWLSIEDKDRLALVLRYLSSSYDKVGLEDKLIDLWIGLETLFSEESTELSYRISLRIARYLDKKEHNKRKEIFNKVKDSYNYRGYIVHGRHGKKKTKQYEGSNLENIVQQTEGYLVDSIKFCLSSHALPRLEDLDNAIARGD